MAKEFCLVMLCHGERSKKRKREIDATRKAKAKIVSEPTECIAYLKELVKSNRIYDGLNR
ncbi:hypothetical protein [Lysinibacillus cavernae]|uniref:hypothetical protein n=1 Tax=Lysinibacillus cavernae TaxID=2666135 RepID=UPI001E611483|nr:hypothetical protein [Lysinibacillus cavernae]